MEKSEIFAMFKERWSKPMDEDAITAHLSINQKSFCGIEKRFIGTYNFSLGPVEHIKESRMNICKTCYKIWISNPK